MKLTDAQVAKALGYEWRLSKWCEHEKASKNCGGCGCWWDKETGLSSMKNGITYHRKDALPDWTTSLDAIVAEIEARGLHWYVGPFLPEYRAQILKYEGAELVSQLTREAATAPLALCAALLAYLKSIRPTARRGK